MDSLNRELVAHSLDFHGQQLEKLWDSERGDDELHKMNLKDLDFDAYQQRQKSLRLVCLASLFSNKSKLYLYFHGVAVLSTTELNEM